ncbi:MAG TPA: cupin domain-containing protein [Candidatus Omnitrophota bacterium]|nr:cupin domain-containing protein [Candidatus Omnitrophota bacterium]HSA32021.1 cupin domain-containing protein [Candidatus Omnitrophota bacterium]
MNVLEKIPYANDTLGKRKLIDEKHLLIMQIALHPGQSVPSHNANSNVHLLILRGNLCVDLRGTEYTAQEGDLLPVAFQTPMSIKNTGTTDATFLVLKTPNPSEMA